ncbi:probable receptor-like protein kinase At5g24010 [Vigna radiata var. radiata]|uniref:Probable receptor-like protein kinase At5g24010 n=1 Tax=Vigna radiata var. radiata TaxID=3916 RepID=A0A1S3UKC9_VIGRR|nr:probable receptor-like protein kinase At5g24010 [Vigna radiata var. radiata]
MATVQLCVALLFLLQLSSLQFASLGYDVPDKYFINCGSDNSVTESGKVYVGESTLQATFSSSSIERNQSSIHRDVKSTNILLDENHVAKVADFGLSRSGPTDTHPHVTTGVKGTFGYLDPEYFGSQQLTEKSDVYSFGVVLLEVLCARAAIDPSLPTDQINLAEWGLLCKKKGILQDIIDPSIIDQIDQNSLRKFVETIEKCLEENGSNRPSMGDVLWDLEYALQLQTGQYDDSSSGVSASLQLTNVRRLPSLSTLSEA